MKKFFAITMCLCLVLGTFAGCHGAYERNEFQVPEEFDTSRNYELVFWAKNESNIRQKEVYEQAIADFEKLGKTDPMFARLHALVQQNGGLWNAEAEAYLLAKGPRI